jgi:hypothetical protein
MRAATVVAVAVAALGGCSSGSPTAASPSSDAMRPGQGTLPTGTDVYDAPSGILIEQLFADNGVVSVLWDDSQSVVGLTKVGSQTPVFTTPMTGGLPSLRGMKLAVVVAAGNAFYVSQGALHAVSMDTGNDQVLGLPGDCVPMFADATAVFCALGGTVFSLSLPQGNMQMVADLSPSKADDLYADATTLYLTASPSSHTGIELWSAPRGGGSATMLATANMQEGDFYFVPGQADDANVYLGIANGYARMSKSTHQIAVVTQNGPLSSGYGFAYISGGYFYTGGNSTSGVAEILTRGPLATGMPATDIAATTPDMIGMDDIVITSDAAYWFSFLESGGHGIVARAPLPK